jgi:hypothetical protein
LFAEKSRGRKSRDIVPLTNIFPDRRFQNRISLRFRIYIQKGSTRGSGALLELDKKKNWGSKISDKVGVKKSTFILLLLTKCQLCTGIHNSGFSHQLNPLGKYTIIWLFLLMLGLQKLSVYIQGKNILYGTNTNTKNSQSIGTFHPLLLIDSFME